MDYKLLLQKYMTLVIECESVSFLDNMKDRGVSVSFSEEEIQELRKMEEIAFS